MKKYSLYFLFFALSCNKSEIPGELVLGNEVFDTGEVIEIINTFIRTGKTACFEVVEVNPTLDTDNRMAIAAFEVLNAVTSVIEEVHLG